MEHTASVNTERKTIGNRTFYKSTYMDVSVIRTNDGYYNATKICQDNGISDVGQLMRYKWWKEYCDMVKQYGKYDHETNKIVPDFDLLNEKHAAKTQPVLNDQITDEILMFSMDRQEDKYNWISGTYVHEIFINMILVHVDKVYAFKVSHLINLMNEELQLRNITLEQKISEQEKLIQDLKDLHEKSGRGKNHDKPGCIFYRPWNDVPNAYKIWFCEVEKHYTDKNIKTINDIYNPKDTCATLNIATKNRQFDDMKWMYRVNAR